MSLFRKNMCKLYNAFGLSYFSEEDGKKAADKILYQKVQNPYDSSLNAPLIDILLNTAMTGKAIKEVFNSYGIDFTKDGVDITNNAAMEYMLYHGKSYHYKVNNENVSIDTTNGFDAVPDVLPIIPNSHLDHIQQLIASSKEGFNSYFGQAAEFSVKSQLELMGYKTILPTDRNIEAVDLFSEKKFFTDNNIPYKEHPDLPGMGMIQIKTTSHIYPTKGFTSNTEHHFAKNPDIPVLASTKIVDAMPAESANGMMTSFEQIGLDEFGAEKEIYKQFLAIKDIHGESLIKQFNLPTGADISTPELIAIKDPSYLFDGFGFDSIPLLGVALSTSFSAYSNYRRLKDNEISIKQAINNVGAAAAKTAAVGTLSVAGSQFVMTEIFGTNAGTQLLEGGDALLGEDFSLDELEEMGEAALVVGLIVAMGYGAKKVWEFFAGNPLEKYSNLMEEKDTIESDLTRVTKKYTNDIYKETGVYEALKVAKQLKNTQNDLTKEKKVYTLGTNGVQSLNPHKFTNCQQL